MNIHIFFYCYVHDANFRKLQHAHLLNYRTITPTGVYTTVFIENYDDCQLRIIEFIEYIDNRLLRCALTTKARNMNFGFAHVTPITVSSSRHLGLGGSEFPGSGTGRLGKFGLLLGPGLLGIRRHDLLDLIF